MPSSLHPLTAEIFKTLGHPMRIRVGQHGVAELLLPEVANLSMSLALLRRAGQAAELRAS